MSTYDYDLIFQGQTPEFEGQILEQLIGQNYQTDDELYSPHQVFILVNDQWWRLFVDGPMLYVQRQEKAPEAWALPEDQMVWSLRDLGRELNVRGTVLSGWCYGQRNRGPTLSLNFESGLQITFFSTDGEHWSTFDVTQWMVSRLT